MRIVAMDIAAGTDGIGSNTGAAAEVGGFVRLGVHELRWKLFFFLTLNLYAARMLEFSPKPTLVPVALVPTLVMDAALLCTVVVDGL